MYLRGMSIVSTGSFGAVYSGKYCEQAVAVKVLNTAGLLSAADEALFWREVNVTYTCRHQHLVLCHGACVDHTVQPPLYALVMERCQGTLLDFLPPKGSIFSFSKKSFYCVCKTVHT